MNSAAGQVQSAMQRMAQAVQSSGQRMIQMGRQAGTQTGRNIASGIQSAVGQVGSAMDSLVNAAAARANAGVGRMRAAGAQIGNGLAQGMLSALGAVTAAANALVAQAERAAQAAAKIHSPSRLFRDNVGIYLGQGLAVGIDKSVKYVKSSIADMIDTASRYAISARDLFEDNNIFDSFDGGKMRGSIDLSLADDARMDRLEQALDLITDLVGRPISLNINGREFAYAAADDMSSYQKAQEFTYKRMRGLE